jgi:MSHA biogenesis protein MshL
MPTLPLTQLDERILSADLDNRAFSLTFAQPVPINNLLLMLVRGTSLSIIPDPSLGGSFIGELKNVTVRQALVLILQPLGLDFTVEGAFIRVFKRQPETRLYNLNYIASERLGDVRVGGEEPAGRPTASSARVTTTTKTDVFGDLAKGIQTLLSDRGTFNIDRKAGLAQVTDFPERLDRVAAYVDSVQDRVHRQVQIDARVLEVELNDTRATTIDWDALGTSKDATRLMAALSSQGKVSVLASPRLVVMNNEPAIVKTDGLSISVTPQIAADSVVTLSLSPIVSSPTRSEVDTLARVADGETIVVAGFGRDQEVGGRKNAKGPGGWFGRSTPATQRRVELVVMLTPRIVTAGR